jgi:hypothetical protein
MQERQPLAAFTSAAATSLPAPVYVPEVVLAAWGLLLLLLLLWV